MLIRGSRASASEIVLALRRDLFDHLTALSLRYFSEQQAGWIIARLTSDVDAVSRRALAGDARRSSRTRAAARRGDQAVVVDWRLGLVVIAIVPPALVLSRWYQRRSSVAWSRPETGSPR